MKKILIVLLSIQITNPIFVKRPSSHSNVPSSAQVGITKFNKIIENGNEAEAIKYFDQELRGVLPDTDKSLQTALTPFFQTFYKKRAMTPEDNETLQDLVDSLSNRPVSKPSSASSSSSWQAMVFEKLMKRISSDDTSYSTEEAAQKRIDEWMDAYNKAKKNEDALFKQLDEILRKKFPGLPKTGPLTSEARNQAIKRLDLASLSSEDQDIVANAAILKEDSESIKKAVTAAATVDGDLPPPPPPPPFFSEFAGGPPPPPPPPIFGAPMPPPVFGGGSSSSSVSGSLIETEIIKPQTVPEIQASIKKLIDGLVSATKETSTSTFDQQSSTAFGLMKDQMKKIEKFYRDHPNNSEDAHKKFDLLLPAMKLIVFLFDMLNAKTDYVALLQEVKKIDTSGQEWANLIVEVSDTIDKQVEKKLTGSDKKDLTTVPKTDGSSSTSDDEQPSGGGMLAGFKGLRKTATTSSGTDDTGVQDQLITSLAKWHVVIEKIAECKKEIIGLNISISQKTSEYLRLEEEHKSSLLKEDLAKIKDDIKGIRENIKKVKLKITELETYRNKTKDRLVREYKDYIADLERQVTSGHDSGVTNLKAAYEKIQRSVNQYDLKALASELTKSLDTTEKGYSDWQLDVLQEIYRSDDALSKLSPAQRDTDLSNDSGYHVMQKTFVNCFMDASAAINNLALQKELVRIESLAKIRDNSSDKKEGVVSLFTKAMYGLVAWKILYIMISTSKSDELDESSDAKEKSKLIKTMKVNNIPTLIIPADIQPAEEPFKDAELLKLYSNVFIPYRERYLVEPVSSNDAPQENSNVLTSRDFSSLKEYVQNYTGATEIIKTYDDISGDQFMFAKEFINPTDLISGLEIGYIFDKSLEDLKRLNKLAAFNVDTLSFNIGFLCSKIKLQLDTFINYKKNSKNNYRIVLLAPRVFNCKTDILVAKDESKKPRYMINPSMITEEDITSPKATLLDLVIIAWRLDLLDKDPLKLTTALGIDEYFTKHGNDESVKENLRTILIKELKGRTTETYKYACYLMYDKGITNTGAISRGNFFEALYAKNVKRMKSSERDSLDQNQVVEMPLGRSELEEIATQFVGTLNDDQIGAINRAKSLFTIGKQPITPIVKPGSTILSNSKNAPFYTRVGKIPGLEFLKIATYIESRLKEDQKKTFKEISLYFQIKIVNAFYDQLYNAIEERQSSKSDEID